MYNSLKLNGEKNKKRNRKRKDYSEKKSLIRKHNKHIQEEEYSNIKVKKKCIFQIIIIILFVLIISSFIFVKIIQKKNISKPIYLRYTREEAFQRGRIYLNKCLEGLLIHNQTFKKNNNNIKITVIIPLFNKEKIIKSVIRSIQNQNIEEIEIIIVNDFSTDNSSKVVEEMQKEDSRIKLINNQKNLGILYSRAIGVFEAKGKYIVNLDHDDLFFDEDVLQTTLFEAEEGNFDILSFIDVQARHYYARVKRMKDGLCANNPDNTTVYQPELSYYLIFKNERFAFIDIRIWGKLIKNEVYKKAMNFLGKERYSVFNIINEDIIGIFAISMVAQSYKYIRKYGVFHYKDRNTASRTTTMNHFMYMDIYFSEILFDLSKNENKKYAAFIIIPIKHKYYYTIKEEKTKLYLIKVIKKILNCEYIEEKYKAQIKKEYSYLGNFN